MKTKMQIWRLNDWRVFIMFKQQSWGNELPFQAYNPENVSSSISDCCWDLMKERCRVGVWSVIEHKVASGWIFWLWGDLWGWLLKNSTCTAESIAWYKNFHCSGLGWDLAHWKPIFSSPVSFLASDPGQSLEMVTSFKGNKLPQLVELSSDYKWWCRCHFAYHLWSVKVANLTHYGRIPVLAFLWMIFLFCHCTLH